MSKPKVFEGRKLDFSVEREDWNVYKLEDGATLKVKLVLVDVIRTPEHNPLGEPIYRIFSQNVVKALNVPDELKRKPKESTTPIA
ncbi:MAG: hypothetical protein ACE5Z5_04875 [Candidatus Bathyarchaeia archaeon]